MTIFAIYLDDVPSDNLHGEARISQLAMFDFQSVDS